MYSNVNEEWLYAFLIIISQSTFAWSVCLHAKVGISNIQVWLTKCTLSQGLKTSVKNVFVYSLHFVAHDAIKYITVTQPEEFTLVLKQTHDFGLVWLFALLLLQHWCYLTLFKMEWCKQNLNLIPNYLKNGNQYIPVLFLFTNKKCLPWMCQFKKYYRNLHLNPIMVYRHVSSDLYIYI